MEKKMHFKRLFSVLLAFLVVFAAIPGTAMVCAAGDTATTVTTYEEFAAAIADQAETIELGADITVTETLNFDYSATINGNDYTLTRDTELMEPVIKQTAGDYTLTMDSVVIDGAGIEAEDAAIYIGSGNTFTAVGCTVQNCVNTEGYGGGVFSEDKTTITLDGCTIKDCYAEEAAGLCVNEWIGDENTDVFKGNVVSIKDCTISGNETGDQGYGGGLAIYGAEKVTIDSSFIDSNTAYEGGGAFLKYCGATKETDEDAAEAVETGVTITDTEISNNYAENNSGGLDMSYSVVRIYGESKLYDNTCDYGAGAVSADEKLYDNRGYASWLFLRDDVELYGNSSDDDGGAIDAGWFNLIMSDNVCIHDNEAWSGGGIMVGNGYGLPTVFKMKDNATIRDNKSEWGGGLLINEDHEDSVRHLIAKNIYDNIATGELAEGDDIFFNFSSTQEADYFLFATQDARPYGDGNSTELGTVVIEPIEGYDKEPTLEDGVMVPWLGWFEDVEDNRYANPQESTLITDTFDHELGTSTDVSFGGYKAIWYGLAMAYDANFTDDNGGPAPEFGTQAYKLNDDTTVQDNMFDRPGYRFTGWNTAADGSGEAYAAEDTLKLEKSTVLYAQWERKTGNLTVSKTVSGNAASETKAFTFTVTLFDTSISGKYGEMTFENGVATFTLKGGESLTAEGLPAGVKYTVVEGDNSGYEVTSIGDAGDIVEDETVTAAFTNTKNSSGGSPTPTPTPVPAPLNGEDHFAYVIGYPDGNVHPEANVTRAEVATIFFRLLKDEVRDANWSETNSFSDVNANNWFNNAVSTMVKMGVVTGYPDGTFKPNENITRAEFAAIAARFDENASSTKANFSDISGHWAAMEIAKAAANGWVNGYPDGTFKPDQKITRAEAMALVNRVLNRDPGDPSDLLDNMIKWPDNMDTGKWFYLDVQEATNSHTYERTAKVTEKWLTIEQPRDWAALER